MPPMKKKFTALGALLAISTTLAAWRNLQTGNPALETLEILTGAGADLNIQDHLGQTPLHYAALEKGTPAAKSHGQTALHLFAIARRGNAEIVARMLKSGADHTIRDIDGNTPLDLAMRGDPRAGRAPAGPGKSI